MIKKVVVLLLSVFICTACINKSEEPKLEIIDIHNATIMEISDQKYTGEAITPEVVVTIGDEILVEGVDYTLKYQNNVNTGTATVLVVGIGKYQRIKVATFKIVKASKPKAKITCMNKAYNGEVQVIATCSGGTVSNASKKDVGSFTVTCKGDSDHTDATSVLCSINAADISGATVSSIAKQKYTGKQITPTPTVKVGSRTLTKDTDYTLSYGNNIEAGTANITISGKGNYKGTKAVTFKIVNNNFKINYKGNGATSGSVSSHTCTMNGTCTIKSNGFTKSGYTFVGWTTKSNGVDDGYKWTNWSGKWTWTNGQYGISNNTLNLYAMWKTAAAPAIVPSSPSIKYEGSTLKYYIKRESGYYLTYIWMKDPFNQIKKLESNAAEYGKVMTDQELASEGKQLRLNNVGQMVEKYISKGMISSSKALIAFNASGYWTSAMNYPTSYYINRSDSWLVVTDGIVTRNRPDDAILADFEPRVVGITKTGDLKFYDITKGKDISVSKNIYNSVIADGVKNTWSFYPALIQNGKNIMWDDNKIASRQAICQVDSNNYIMFSHFYGYTTKRLAVANILFNLGCKTAFNFDGGGSISIFYKTGSGTSANKLLCTNSASGGCREIVEGIYFVEQ